MSVQQEERRLRIFEALNRHGVRNLVQLLADADTVEKWVEGPAGIAEVLGEEAAETSSPPPLGPRGPGRPRRTDR